MYTIVLSTLIGVSANSVDCFWGRNGHNNYAEYGNCPSCAPVVEMPMGCGCPPCPSCGGAPMDAPPMMGLVTPPIGGPGMPAPPADGNVLPPLPLGDSVPPLNAPPALNEQHSLSNQAQFVVRLPADARLVVEGVVIPGSGSVREFFSPTLEPGRDYWYDLVIEVDRNGKILRDSKTMKFQAGKTANVTFPEPRADSAAPPLAVPAAPMTSRIRVRIPEGAALYVEGQRWTTPFVQTPPLDPSRIHYYQLQVETIRDGRRAVLTREVAFRAGQDLTVDFTTNRPNLTNVVKESR